MEDRRMSKKPQDLSHDFVVWTFSGPIIVSVTPTGEQYTTGIWIHEDIEELTPDELCKLADVLVKAADYAEAVNG
jgi:hypothetical protein